MNAGSSGRGQHFAAKYCDLVFINFRSQEFEDCKARVEGYRKLAREEYGRDIKVWSLAYIVQRETEKEARAFHDHYVNELGDWEAARNVLATMSMTKSDEQKQSFNEAAAGRFIAGWAGMPLIGTREQVVDGLQRLSDIGLDGVLLSWPRFVDEMRQFRDETYPLAVQAGLR
jgi:alkanesulfonate monooxygenase SsuD/methylene tetrahydromethanopterin reductase-like flavin-dependent oxidoreductase (luciferase family)